jgi:hypothetical protein
MKQIYKKRSKSKIKNAILIDNQHDNWQLAIGYFNTLIHNLPKNIDYLHDNPKNS